MHRQSFLFPSSRRTPGPRLATSEHAESLDPDFRRDDGRKNEFNALIIAKMATKPPCLEWLNDRTYDQSRQIDAIDPMLTSARAVATLDTWQELGR